MARKIEEDLRERVKIQEKALLELAEKLSKREAAFGEEMQEALEELKAIKMFLSRTSPEFKKQFPDIRKKIKKAA
jgi:hypothetical protein